MRGSIGYDYVLGLKGLCPLPARRAGASHVFHQYVIRVADRSAVQERLRDAGIGTNVHYPVPVHRQPAYEGHTWLVGHGRAGKGLPATEAAAGDVLSLPMFPQLTDAQVDEVIAAVRTVLAK